MHWAENLAFLWLTSAQLSLANLFLLSGIQLRSSYLYWLQFINLDPILRESVHCPLVSPLVKHPTNPFSVFLPLPVRLCCPLGGLVHLTLLRIQFDLHLAAQSLGASSQGSLACSCHPHLTSLWLCSVMGLGIFYSGISKQGGCQEWKSITSGGFEKAAVGSPMLGTNRVLSYGYFTCISVVYILHQNVFYGIQ